jgi:tetratricopeptide (TPR) repeat protein
MEADVAAADRRLREKPQMKWLAIAALLVCAPAGADTVADHLARVRELYEKGEFVRARDELLAAYKVDPRPELLFALGQVELNIGHYKKAIDYYEQFIATEPGAEQVALAQQAIGAARARLAEAPPAAAPARRIRHREWDIENTGLVTLGGTALLVGAGLTVYGLRLAGDRSGTLSEYEDRLSHAERTQWIGAGCITVGALAIGGAVLRWRLRLVDTEIQPIAGPHAAGVSLVTRW